MTACKYHIMHIVKATLLVNEIEDKVTIHSPDVAHDLDIYLAY